MQKFANFAFVWDSLCELEEFELSNWGLTETVSATREINSETLPSWRFESTEEWEFRGSDSEVLIQNFWLVSSQRELKLKVFWEY